jgi:hypothetical protein
VSDKNMLYVRSLVGFVTPQQGIDDVCQSMRASFSAYSVRFWQSGRFHSNKGLYGALKPGLPA